MLSSDTPLLARLTGRIAWLDRRGEILARNIANADTPGYRARDLKETGFSRHLPAAATRPRRTDARHLAGTVPAAPVVTTDGAQPGDAKLNGNTVNLERQLMHVANTRAEHRLALNLYRKHLGMLRIALGRPG